MRKFNNILTLGQLGKRIPSFASTSFGVSNSARFSKLRYCQNFAIFLTMVLSSDLHAKASLLSFLGEAFPSGVSSSDQASPMEMSIQVSPRDSDSSRALNRIAKFNEYNPSLSSQSLATGERLSEGASDSLSLNASNNSMNSRNAAPSGISEAPTALRNSNSSPETTTNNFDQADLSVGGTSSESPFNNSGLITANNSTVDFTASIGNSPSLIADLKASSLSNSEPIDGSGFSPTNTFAPLSLQTPAETSFNNGSSYNNPPSLDTFANFGNELSKLFKTEGETPYASNTVGQDFKNLTESDGFLEEGPSTTATNSEPLGRTETTPEPQPIAQVSDSEFREEPLPDSEKTDDKLGNSVAATPASPTSNPPEKLPSKTPANSVASSGGDKNAASKDGSEPTKPMELSSTNKGAPEKFSAAIGVGSHPDNCSGEENKEECNQIATIDGPEAAEIAKADLTKLKDSEALKDSALNNHSFKEIYSALFSETKSREKFDEALAELGIKDGKLSQAEKQLLALIRYEGEKTTPRLQQIRIGEYVTKGFKFDTELADEDRIATRSPLQNQAPAHDSRIMVNY